MRREWNQISESFLSSPSDIDDDRYDDIDDDIDDGDLSENV